MYIKNTNQIKIIKTNGKDIKHSIKKLTRCISLCLGVRSLLGIIVRGRGLSAQMWRRNIHINIMNRINVRNARNRCNRLHGRNSVNSRRGMRNRRRITTLILAVVTRHRNRFMDGRWSGYYIVLDWNCY